MASAFSIFEDHVREKENCIERQPQSKMSGGILQEKRSILGDKRDTNILKNDVKEQKAKNLLNLKDDHATQSQNVTLKAAASVPVDQFKAFSVYEDTDKKHDDIAAVAELNLSVREPFTELGVSTPMSVAGVLSPMSVDKSIVVVDEAVPDDTKLPAPTARCDSERFFDVVEYQNDILVNLRESEKKHRPKAEYMKKQPDITHSMRTILIDWLIEVGEEYRLHSETLHLAVSYIDRFLSQMSVVRAKLQLVGTAAMFIAAKYEEIYPPDVSEFVYITDDTYTRTQVLRMEMLILKVLSFDLGVPSLLCFTTLYCTMNDIPENVKHLTMYFCELSLLEASPYLHYHPSKTSAAALALARYTCGMPMWSKKLEETTTYALEDLKEIVSHLSKSHEASSGSAQQAAQEKYKSSKYSCVSSIPPATVTDASFKLDENNEGVSNMSSNVEF